MIDVDTFLERAAIMEFDGGLSRYQAETEAARAQGVARWQALKAVNDANISGNSQRGGHYGSALERDGQGHMPDVQPAQEKQDGQVFVGDVYAGRNSLDVPSLRNDGGRVS
jgi:hypothetical protein